MGMATLGDPGNQTNMPSQHLGLMNDSQHSVCNMQASWETRVPSSEAVGPHWLQGMRASWGRGLPGGGGFPTLRVRVPRQEGLFQERPDTGMSCLCHVQSTAVWHTSHQDGDRWWHRSSFPALRVPLSPAVFIRGVFSVCPRNPASLCASSPLLDPDHPPCLWPQRSPPDSSPKSPFLLLLNRIGFLLASKDSLNHSSGIHPFPKASTSTS